METRAVRQAILRSAVLLVVLTAAGCAPGVPTDPPTGPAGSPSSSRRARTEPDAALRTRLADALRSADPISASALADASTRLAVLDAAWLPGWQVVDVQVRRMPHPQRFYVGLSATAGLTT